jgi:hypothetical protein
MLYFFLVLSTVIYFLVISYNSENEDKSSLSNIICDSYVKSANITEVPADKQLADCKSGSGSWIILLIFAEIGVAIVIYYTLRRLFNYVRIVAGFFFGSDVVDSFNKDSQPNKLSPGGVILGSGGIFGSGVNKQDVLQKVENNCKEQLHYLNKKDWTMAGIYWDRITEVTGLFKDYPEGRKPIKL